MKKIAAILAFTLNVIAAMAQDQFDFNDPTIPLVADKQVSSQIVSGGHAINVTVLGMEYSYELPLSGPWTIVFRGGGHILPTGITYDKDLHTHKTTRTYHIHLEPDIILEPRFYTNIDRRRAKGKKTANNSADFVSVKTVLYTWTYRDIQLSVIPVYGIRRGGEHWFREYSFGVGYHTAWELILPYANFRLGYTF